MTGLLYYILWAHPYKTFRNFKWYKMHQQESWLVLIPDSIEFQFFSSCTDYQFIFKPYSKFGYLKSLMAQNQGYLKEYPFPFKTASSLLKPCHHDPIHRDLYAGKRRYDMAFSTTSSKL